MSAVTVTDAVPSGTASVYASVLASKAGVRVPAEIASSFSEASTNPGRRQDPATRARIRMATDQACAGDQFENIPGGGGGGASVAVILYVSIVLPSAAVQTVSMSSGVPATMGIASDGLPVATSFPSTLHFVDATLTVGVTYTSADFVHSRNVQVTENSK